MEQHRGVPTTRRGRRYPRHMSEDDGDREPGRRMPGLIFWVWALVLTVFIALTVYITVAG